MCSDQNISLIDHNEIILPDIHLNKGKLHLSNYENLTFTDFLLQID